MYAPIDMVGDEVVLYHYSYTKNSLLVKFISLRYMPTRHKSVKLLAIPNSVAYQFAVIIEGFLSISNYTFNYYTIYATYCHTLNS